MLASYFVSSSTSRSSRSSRLGYCYGAGFLSSIEKLFKKLTRTRDRSRANKKQKYKVRFRLVIFSRTHHIVSFTLLFFSLSHRFLQHIHIILWFVVQCFVSLPFCACWLQVSMAFILQGFPSTTISCSRNQPLPSTEWSTATTKMIKSKKCGRIHLDSTELSNVQKMTVFAM